MATSKKKREAIIKKARKNFKAALESYQEVEVLTMEYGVRRKADNTYRETLNELSDYYERCVWWEREPE